MPLIKIDDWNFDWQNQYRYAEPVRLPAGATVHMRFTYDNSADNPRNPSVPPRRVTYGEQTFDEMGYGFLEVVPDDPSQFGEIRRAMVRRAVERRLRRRLGGD